MNIILICVAKELHNLWSNQGGTKEGEYAACIGKVTNSYIHLEDVDVDVRIILEWILKK
jgi:uncharacterized protein YqgC (DUF456 family)